MGFVNLSKLAGALCTAALFAATTPASAQNVVAKSAVDGRIVELMSDRTWRYADEVAAGPDGCRQLVLNVSFCGTSDGWTQTDPPSPEIAAQYFYDDRNYGQYVIEGIGSDDGVTQAFFRGIVIENAASAAGIPAEDVVILNVAPEKVSDKDAETIIYQVGIDGLEIVFINTVAVLPKRSIQAMTFSVGKVLTPEHQALHAQFLGHTDIK